jgi:4-diphosphocytidyl-2-C-methyl-D-erythritol kinase
MNKLSIQAPSKINLFLKVTGRRPDGYHTLHTLFMPVAKPADDITIELDAESGISISCDHPFVPTDSRNICYKAAELYAQKAEVAPNWAISICKQIPVAAGMGGGSGNAAAVLSGLNKFYKKLSPEEISELALQCGADVPFFLNPRPAIASGVGEIFNYPELNYKKIPMLLINPKFPVSAAWAYKHLNPEHIGASEPDYAERVIIALNNNDLDSLGKLVRNDLAFALYVKFPILSLLREQLLDNGAPVAEITGSGPTIFALFRDSEHLKSTSEILKAEYPTLTFIETQL